MSWGQDSRIRTGKEGRFKNMIVGHKSGEITKGSILNKSLQGPISYDSRKMAQNFLQVPLSHVKDEGTCGGHCTVQ